MSELIKIIEEAQTQLETYKHPDTSEAERRLDEILRAGQLGGISGDELTDLSFHNGFLHIHTRYSVRSCEQRGHYQIPRRVLTAEDPIGAIKVWAKDQRVAKARAEVADAERTLERRREALAKAKAEPLENK